MKKKILILALSACAALLFSSCDNEKKPEKKTDVPVSTDTPISSTADTPKTTTSNIPSLTTTVTPISTVPAKDMVTVNIYEGSGKDDRVLIESQSVEKNKTLLDQLKAPNKPGFKFLRFHFASSYNDVYLEADYVIKKNLDIYASFDSIDYNSVYNQEGEISDKSGYSYYITGTDAQKANLFQNGYVKGEICDFSKYENTDAYVQVKSADEFISALNNAQIDYTSEVDEKIGDNGYIIRKNVRVAKNWPVALAKGLFIKNSDGTFTKIPEDTPWDPNDPVYTNDMDYYEESNYVDVSLKQTLIKDATVHVIEITNDIDLGYYKLSDTAKKSGIVTNFCDSYQSAIDNGTASFSYTSFLTDNGISQIKISRANNLLIYSKNGAKITHAGFSVESCNGVAVRNIEMDELWQWEDTPTETPNFTCGDMDVFGWAYFKIGFSQNIWIDHCTFGKSYDGQIDVSNPYFYAELNASRAPYGVPAVYDAEKCGGVHISNCKFLSGSDDRDGYLYKMMEEIEADYQKSKSDSTYNCKFVFYQKLRDEYDLTFEEILYGIAIPQKKGFLLGDSSESQVDYSYHFNKALKVSMANNVFVDFEDRIPNVRGGIAYMYNCVVDNSRYTKYRSILLTKGVTSISAVYTRPGDTKNENPYFKLAIVSQGIIGGYGASICAENCVFIGVSTLIKNNNSKGDVTTEQKAAGYKIINCIWYNDKDDTENKTRIINTDTDPNQIQLTVDQKSPMTVAYFDWHNETNTKPFEVSLYKLDELMDKLWNSYHIGTNSYLDKLFLYTDAMFYPEKAS